MSTEWDHEFQRLENGEVAHIATAELLNWQVSALIEEEPQYIEAHCMFDSPLGSVHMTRDFMADDYGEITHTIELFSAPENGGAGISLIELIYTPETTFLSFVNQDLDNPLKDILFVLDAVRALEHITPQDAEYLEELAVLCEAVVLIDEEDLPDELIYNVGCRLVKTINRRTDVHSISSQCNSSNAEQMIKLTQQRYVDMSFEKPQLSDVRGEFEIIVTDKKSQSAICITGGYGQEIYTTDAYDLQTGADSLRLASLQEQQDLAKTLAKMLRPTLLKRSPEWLSEYSHRIGWSIHNEGKETPNATAIGEELHHVRTMFVSRLEAINHFIPRYTSRNFLDTIGLYLADQNCHPNGFGVTTDELVDFNNMTVQKLDGTTSRTAIYLGTRFLEPTVELQNIAADYGAYVDVILAVEDTNTEDNPIRIGSIALNQCEMVISDKSFN